MNTVLLKKRLSLVFLFLFVLSMCSCEKQQSKNKSEKTELNQTVTVWLLTERVSYLNDTEDSRFTYTYDNNGNMIAEHFYSRGEQLSHTAYSFDEDNNMTAKTEYRKDGTITQYTFSYEFDETGNVVKTIQYKEGEEDNVTTYFYNKNNNLIEEVTALNGSETSKTTYTYATNGNQIGKSYFIGEKEEYRNISEFDRNNRRTKWALCNADGTERERYVYRYNLSGDLISREYYHGGVFAYKTEYTLNEAGVPISWTQGEFEKGTYDYQVVSCLLERAYALQERYGTGRVIIQ